MHIRERLQDRVFSLAASIIILCVVMTFIFPTQFATIENFSQLLLNLSIDTIVAVGMMILMISGMFDLSVGSVVAFAGGLAGYLMYYHDVNFLVAILAALSGSLLIGVANGWLIAVMGINPMIQTLAMMGIVRGLALMLSGAGIQNFPYDFIYIGQTKILGLQAPVWYMIVIVLLFSFLVNRTVFFRRYYFIGGNERAAKLSGIRVEKMKISLTVPPTGSHPTPKAGTKLIPPYQRGRRSSWQIPITFGVLAETGNGYGKVFCVG